MGPALQLDSKQSPNTLVESHQWPNTGSKLIEHVAQAQTAGFARTKFKSGPDSGVAMVADVHTAFPDAVIHV
jgi:L-alanine-DL-glutamate epimerase-like enolase superfamily enzyme